MVPPLINFTEPFAVLVALVLFVLIVWLGKETKKSFIPCIMLLVFLTLLVSHAIELYAMEASMKEIISNIAISIAVDFVFIFLSFFSYLWIDDIEAKATKKKSIDNSLDWFWKKV